MTREEKHTKKIARAAKRIKANRARKESYFLAKEGVCPECGGEMTWCDICRMYSADCCQEYGTCACS